MKKKKGGRGGGSDRERKREVLRSLLHENPGNKRIRISAEKLPDNALNPDK